MKIVVRPAHSAQDYRWQVCMDQHAVSFRTEADAQRFVATLEARLRAPHTLPLEPRRQAG